MAIVDATRCPAPLDDAPQTGRIEQVALGAPRYPARLAAAAAPPAVLWYTGRLPGGRGAPAVAIVGSRAATGSGCARSRALAAGLAARGWTVISGGAFGIDAAAHGGALEAGGQTFAVLGCGVDVVYPDRHGPLFARIAGESGGLLSQFPPGTAPRRGHFPARNRIIAALADLVLVVEAAARSGALITARFARRSGQPVLAVPGSSGTDALLRAGVAVEVGSVQDVEDAAAGRRSARQGSLLPRLAEAPAPYTAAVAALRERADDPAGLARRLGMPIPAVMALLVQAELDGWVRRVPGSIYEVPRVD